MKKVFLISIALVLIVAGFIVYKAKNPPFALVRSADFPRISQSALQPGTFDFSVEHNKLLRTFRLHMPPSFTRDQRFPLVIVLHGGRDTAEGIEKLTGFNAVADKNNFIVVYPDAIGTYRGSPYWNDGRVPNVDDVAFISALIDVLVAQASVDPGRVYATGFSNGASMTNRLGVELTNKIIAIAPVAGTIPTRLAKNWEVAPALPVLYTHGTKDPFAYYYEGGSAGTRKGSGLSAEDYVAWFARRNGCEQTPTITNLPNSTSDGTIVGRWHYKGCRGGAQVVFYKVENGGHTWPGGWQWIAEDIAGKTTRDINASEEMWGFFKQFKRIKS